MNQVYRSEGAFRSALQKRLMNCANEKGIDVQQLMKKVAFDRFLCRLFSDDSSPWLLKGGYAIELLFDVSRTTKDIDLVLRSHKINRNGRAIGEIDLIKESLIAYSQRDLNDFFSFVLTGEEKTLDNTPYGGMRYSIECKIGGKRYVSFHIDISSNDVSKWPYFEKVEGEDWIGFAGISPAMCSVFAPEEIFAEKLHAYTLPRDQENTRVRDIVDMYLLIANKKMDHNRISECVNNVFARRKTHEIPAEFSKPPSSWKNRYEQIASTCGINKDIVGVHMYISDYLMINQILNSKESIST